ncbi:hypothetical protein Kpol_1072p7 [Vanderwaltozyma polyspora DSM 70294]|uniref:Translation machinery-associated protein 16 n=1 Tax=Vanderwaltozyma polyspora (strain ATCC 22028 / DSM 70294 / BCRC 21397 / CBS 2163 / NBRC 10782 / NRRL Y-8283 / UCD 57-17) TaxID=436907 RepID=A7TKM5_VANPO|nr:uncharacterized protein Kpol_1072p7 [Vanderwaltozyma polyspora DSM 70294]EDO17137.1 hypothetical protein Kpol_1072p7 [Vanderwaltozyma polyspora DSM 70294]
MIITSVAQHRTPIKMPVSKSLSKIQKRLKTGSKQTTVHPKGRKFQQLNKATIRESKIAAKKKAYNEKRSNELARVKFIQDVINLESFKEQNTFSHEETAVFIQQFIARDDDELDELKKKRRANRPPTSKQQLLEQKKKLELEEFEKGFFCPDLTDEKTVSFLREWNQTFGGVNSIKFIRVTDKGTQVLNSKVELTDIEMQ